MENKRNYGIDLLRLVLMYMVCMLHTLGRGGILAVCQAGTGKYQAFWFLEILSYCAVDGFAIISGFMASDKPRRYEKLVEMWFQAFFYSFVLTLIFTLTGVKHSWKKADMLKCALPVINGKFWYFTAFFALFFVIPVLNRFLFSLNEKKARMAFLVLLVFSCMTLPADAFKLEKGYSALWMMVLYCIGALAKRGRIFEERSTITLVLMWAACIILTWWARVFHGNGWLVNYVSPTILLSGLLMVIIFSRIPLKGTIISRLSPLAFGVYLFQMSPVIWRKFIKDSFSFVVQKNFITATVYVFAFASLIFVSGLVVDFLRSKIAKIIKIPQLSKKIADVLYGILEKPTVILK